MSVEDRLSSHSRSREPSRYDSGRRPRDDHRGDYRRSRDDRHSRDDRYSRDDRRDDHRRRDSRYRDDHRRPRDRSRGRREDGEEDEGPPLVGILPLSQWPRKLHLWDVPPVGFENWTPAQAKSSGLFPLASQSGKYSSNDHGSHHHGHGISSTSLLSVGVNGFSGLAQNNPAAQSANFVKQARRVFVGDLPTAAGGIQDNDLQEFFNQLLEEKNGRDGPGRPVVLAQIQKDRTFAFVEFRTPEEATQAIQFNGVQFHGSNIKIRRPKEYVQLSGLDVLPSFGLDSDRKLYIGDLPTYLTDDQVKELLQSFGELLNFYLAKDASGISKGFAFTEYMSNEATDMCIAGLNGMELGDNKLIVERASSSRAKGVLNSEAPGTSLMTMLATKWEDIVVHPVMVLINIIKVDEHLRKQEIYDEIKEDIEMECQRFGTVKSVTIPRPIPGQQVRGVGKIFVEFSDQKECQAAVKGLNGRRFDGRVVVTGYVPLEKLQAGEL